MKVGLKKCPPPLCLMHGISHTNCKKESLKYKFSRNKIQFFRCSVWEERGLLTFMSSGFIIHIKKKPFVLNFEMFVSVPKTAKLAIKFSGQEINFWESIFWNITINM